MWTWPFAADSFDNLQCWQVKYVNKYVNMARMMSDAISLSSASDPDEFYDAEDSTPIRNVRYKNTVCRRQITKKECQKSDKSLHLQVTLHCYSPVSPDPGSSLFSICSIAAQFFLTQFFSYHFFNFSQHPWKFGKFFLCIIKVRLDYLACNKFSKLQLSLTSLPWNKNSIPCQMV